MQLGCFPRIKQASPLRVRPGPVCPAVADGRVPALQNVQQQGKLVLLWGAFGHVVFVEECGERLVMWYL